MCGAGGICVIPHFDCEPKTALKRIKFSLTLKQEGRSEGRKEGKSRGRERKRERERNTKMLSDKLCSNSMTSCQFKLYCFNPCKELKLRLYPALVHQSISVNSLPDSQ